MDKFFGILRPKSLLNREQDSDIQEVHKAVSKAVRFSAERSTDEDLKKASSIALELEDYDDVGSARRSGISVAVGEVENLIAAIYRKDRTLGWKSQSASTTGEQKAAVYNISYTLQNLLNAVTNEIAPSRKSPCRDLSQKLRRKCSDARTILGVSSITSSDLPGLLEFIASEEQACGRDQKQTTATEGGTWVKPERSSQSPQIIASPGVEPQNPLEAPSNGAVQPWSSQSLLPSLSNVVPHQTHSLHSLETAALVQEKPILFEPIPIPTSPMAVASHNSPQQPEPRTPTQTSTGGNLVDSKPQTLDTNNLASRAVENVDVSAPYTLRKAASLVRTLTSLNKEMANGKVVQLPVISNEAEQGFAHIYHVYLLSNQEERGAWPGKEREGAWSQFLVALEDLVNATTRFSELHRPSKIEIRPLQLKSIQSRDAMKKALSALKLPSSDIWADLDRLLKEEERSLFQSNISTSRLNSIPNQNGSATRTGSRTGSVSLQAPKSRQDSLSNFFEGSHGNRFEDVQITGRDSRTVHDKNGWAERNGVLERLHHVHETVDDRQTAYGRFFVGSTGNTFRGGSISGRDSITIQYG